jgi:hypothetical protein
MGRLDMRLSLPVGPLVSEIYITARVAALWYVGRGKDTINSN